jgi:hypothetical protein
MVSSVLRNVLRAERIQIGRSQPRDNNRQEQRVEEDKEEWLQLEGN